MTFRIGDRCKIKVDNDPDYYNENEEPDPFDGSDYLMYGMEVTIIDISHDEDTFLNVELEWTDARDRTRTYWVNDSILKKLEQPSRTGNKVLDKSLMLEQQFKERKQNARHISVQNGIGKCKKPLPFPKTTITVSISQESVPF